MTTPERFRRRQRREFAALVGLAILMILQGIYFNLQNDSQGKCIADKVDAITDVFTARASLNDENARLTKRDAANTSHAILAAGKIHTQAEFQKIEETYREQTARIKARRAAITERLANNPVPQFPPGQCGLDAPAVKAINAALAAR